MWLLNESVNVIFIFIYLKVMKVLPCRYIEIKPLTFYVCPIFRLLHGRNFMWHFMFFSSPLFSCFFSLWYSTGWVSVQVGLNTKPRGTGGQDDVLLTTSFEERIISGRRRYISVSQFSNIRRLLKQMLRSYNDLDTISRVATFR
jgi:hypothetical protein